MLIRTSPNVIAKDAILRSSTVSFAKFKKETLEDKRTVFLQENTLIFVLNGYKHLHFNDHSLTVEPDKLLFLQRGLYVLSEFIPAGLSYEALVLFSTDSFLKNFFMKYIGPNELTPHATPSPYLAIPMNPLMQSFRDQYLSYFQQPFLNLEALLQLKLEELFLLLISGSHGSEVRAWLHAIAYKQPIDLEYVMSRYLFEPLALSELAQLSGRSLAAFKRDFQEHFKMSPKKWINQQRLTHARMLLQNTPQQVSEIASVTGFENVSYFIKAFKQVFGDTPQAWRTKSAMH